ncbi:MAG: S49 family peptidase [Shimia thalassica]|uniref:S49 family peptidase n=1 Tax=Shimia thalassica TaxID=1715693 RepID=UPI0032969855
MPHEIERILQAACNGVWLIEPDKAAEILGVLALRSQGLPRDWAGEEKKPVYAGDTVQGRRGAVHVLKLHGTIMPRGGMMAQMSGGASMEMFQKAFQRAAEDTTAEAIVLEVDSPGGMVDLVPETADMVFKARREGRPIVAVANTMAASAAYWIASAADELVVTPSGRVGSIGVYTMHDDMAGALEKAGIRRTLISAGSRKTEGNPYGPLDDSARAAVQQRVEVTYKMFTGAVAKYRGVAASVVRADPEKSESHFGGGRAYHAQEAVRLGMADRVATFDETLRRVAQGRRTRSTGMARKRLQMI